LLGNPRDELVYNSVGVVGDHRVWMGFTFGRFDFEGSGNCSQE